MGFSKEMKDFISAYSAGQKINASRTDQEYKEANTARVTATTARENDPDTLKTAADQAKANLEKTRASMGLAAASSGRSERLLNDRLQTSALRRRVLESQLNPPAVGGGLLPPEYASPAGQGALPIGPSTMQTGVEEYAEGGLVPDEDDDEEEGVLDTSPQPAIAQPAAAPTDVSAQSRREPRVPKGLEGVISPALVHDATKAGMTFLARESGLSNPGAVRSPRVMAAARAIAQGQGGLSEEEMQAAKKVVDPNGEMTESQRNMAALGSVYQFWANKGQPAKAEKVAAQMLQYYRNASQRYAAIAAKAAEGGNVDLATKAALKAYQNVPDGNDLEILPNPDGGLMYAVTGPDGNVITKGIATPQQLAASAMGLASGGFDKAILAAAGARETPKEATKGTGRPQTAGDRAKEAENAAAGVEALKTKWQEKNKDKPVDDAYWGEMGDAAQHIMQQNPKVTSREAANAALALVTPGKADPEKADFKLTPGEEGKPNIVKFNNGVKLELDDNQLDVIMNARAARVKAAVEGINKKMEDEDKPGFVDKASTALGSAGGAIGNIAASAAPAIATMGRIAGEAVPTELKERVGSDLRKINELAGRSLQNRGAIPVDDNDRPL